MAVNPNEIERVINTKEFAEKMKNARSVDDVLAAFRNNGIEITGEELVEIANKVISDNNIELDADVLDEVYGGRMSAVSPNLLLRGFTGAVARLATMSGARLRYFGRK